MSEIQKRAHYTIRVVTISLLVLLTELVLGSGGLYLAQVHPSASLIWPVIGFDLGVLMRFGYLMLPVIFTGALLTNLFNYGTVFTCTLIAVGNTLKVYVALRLFGHGPIAGNFKKFVLACIPAALVGSTIGTVALVLNEVTDFSSISAFNANFIQHWSLGDRGGFLVLITWLNWTAGDFIGLIVFTPVFAWALKKYTRPADNG